MTTPPPPPRSRRALGCLFEIVETLVVTVILFWVIQTFVAQPFQVRQVSMQDTIEDGQYVLVDKLTPRFDPYHRGDIIVFNPPANAETEGKEPFIKRVIGVAGDTVEIRTGKVLVNGVVLDEPYLFKLDGTAQPTRPDGDTAKWIVPSGMLFVMGDHRERSSDSRAFGPIALADVIGRAWLRYWPLNEFELLPTDRHPELASPAPGASASPSAPAPSRRPRSPSPKH